MMHEYQALAIAQAPVSRVFVDIRTVIVIPPAAVVLSHRALFALVPSRAAHRLTL
jgi:hypothetical protein